MTQPAERPNQVPTGLSVMALLTFGIYLGGDDVFGQYDPKNGLAVCVVFVFRTLFSAVALGALLMVGQSLLNRQDRTAEAVRSP